MAVDNKLKKQVTSQWLEAFPILKPFTQAKLYKVVGPFLLGIDIVALSDNKYRPHFSLHSLYEGTVVECLKSPRLFFHFVNDKKLQFDIPYTDSGEQHKMAVAVIKNSLRAILADMVKWKDLMMIIDDKEGRYHDYNEHSGLKATLLELKFHAALYLDDAELVNEVFTQIDKDSKTWNMEHFGWLHKDMGTWLKRLHERVNNRAAFMKNLEENNNDPKIKKLIFSPIVR